MVDLCVPSQAMRPKVGTRLLLATVSATALLGGCADVGPGEFTNLVPTTETIERQPANPRSLAALKAYYDAAPDSPERAVAYAVALKQAGGRQEAYSVLKAAIQNNGDDKALLSEYGRLALEFNDVGVAKEALAKADDPQKPDWRIVMARGTALAKESHYEEALPFFERAYALEPSHPSVLSNLALAYTMTGRAEKGEPLLRNAITSGSTDPRVKQNLALVLKVQGKSDIPPRAVAGRDVKAAPVAIAQTPVDAAPRTEAPFQAAAQPPTSGASAITTSSISRSSGGEDAPLPPISAQSAEHDEDYATDMAE